jgi:hypothetical protein
VGNAGLAVVLGVVVLVVGIAAVAGLGFQSKSVVSDSDYTFNSETDADRGAVVVHRAKEGGFTFLGHTMGTVTRTVTVDFVAPAGCSAQLSYGAAWPSPIASCQIDVGVAGTVEGLGITPSGESFVGVTFDVSKECYELAVPGVAWATLGCAPIAS